jgi:hypothetical protein
LRRGIRLHRFQQPVERLPLDSHPTANPHSLKSDCIGFSSLSSASRWIRIRRPTRTASSLPAWT